MEARLVAVVTIIAIVTAIAATIAVIVAIINFQVSIATSSPSSPFFYSDSKEFGKLSLDFATSNLLIYYPMHPNC